MFTRIENEKKYDQLHRYGKGMQQNSEFIPDFFKKLL